MKVIKIITLSVILGLAGCATTSQPVSEVELVMQENLNSFDNQLIKRAVSRANELYKKYDNQLSRAGVETLNNNITLYYKNYKYIHRKSNKTLNYEDTESLLVYNMSFDIILNNAEKDFVFLFVEDIVSLANQVEGQPFLTKDDEDWLHFQALTLFAIAKDIDKVHETDEYIEEVFAGDIVLFTFLKMYENSVYAKEVNKNSETNKMASN